jgi:hypothetical protein
MKTQLTELEIVRMYKAYYSGTTDKVKAVEFKKRKATRVTGLVSWAELPADSEMYTSKILIGKEVM